VRCFLETELIKVTEDNMYASAERAAELLNGGQIVAIPTETVYGLAASIYSEEALKAVYAVKGRPQDNPVIVHISSMDMLDGIVENVPEGAEQLAESFWPGPLTMIFKKTSKVSDTITCGMDSVAVRFPSHPVAHAVIEAAGVPLAAPSANLSGKPSPTTAEHCVHDLWGKVPLILDGGQCDVGVESTVISMTGEHPVILRPGIISLEEIRDVLPDASVSESVTRKVGENEKVLSPGLKYKHYSPDCKVIIVKGDLSKFSDYVMSEHADGDYAMCFAGEESSIGIPCVVYGGIGDARSQAHNIFADLRYLDSIGAKRVFVRAPNESGESMAVSNRLMRAAGFDEVVL